MTTPAQEEDSTNNYRIKDILFFGSPRRILLQSANGPCPLLALCNILLLRNQVTISQDTRYISFNEVVDLVSSYLFDANGAASTGEGNGDVRENLQSCLDILPKLNVGLDVNCKFGGPADFEFTRELAIFDLLDINLFHGWVVSKQDEEAFKLFGHLSYNQVVEKIIAMQDAQQKLEQPQEGGDGSEAQAAQQAIEDGLRIQDFLDRTASQLSYDGLSSLHDVVRERQLGVFFRNSHFNAMLKYEGSLYLLCTDIAFAHSHVVWERLDEVDGDTSYCDANFRVNDSANDEAANLAAAQAAQDQLVALGANAGAGADADTLLAMQLLQEDLQAQEAGRGQQAQAPQQQQRAQERQPLAQSADPAQESGSANRAAQKKCCVVM